MLRLQNSVKNCVLLTPHSWVERQNIYQRASENSRRNFTMEQNLGEKSTDSSAGYGSSNQRLNTSWITRALDLRALTQIRSLVPCEWLVNLVCGILRGKSTVVALTTPASTETKIVLRWDTHDKPLTRLVFAYRTTLEMILPRQILGWHIYPPREN